MNFPSLCLVGYDGVQTDVFHAPEYMGLYAGVCFFHFPYEVLYLHALGLCLIICAGGTGVRELAGALYKVQAVAVPPRLDGVLPDVVKGAYKLHALEVCAVELGHHGLHLRPPQHTHEYSLYNVVIVVAQCYLVAAQLLCVAVEIPPAHSGAEVAGGLFNMVNRLEYV